MAEMCGLFFNFCNVCSDQEGADWFAILVCDLSEGKQPIRTNPTPSSLLRSVATDQGNSERFSNWQLFFAKRSKSESSEERVGRIKWLLSPFSGRKSKQILCLNVEDPCVMIKESLSIFGLSSCFKQYLKPSPRFNFRPWKAGRVEKSPV